MKIAISGKHMNLGESLTMHIEERLQTAVTKYLNNVTHAEVSYSKSHNFYDCSIVVHEKGIGIIKADNHSDEPYEAFDKALVKLEKQLRKYHEKIKKHHKKLSETDHVEPFQAKKYILSDNISYDETTMDGQETLTIAEKLTEIQKLTVSEAIMKMELAALPAMLFIHAANGRLNLVYKRPDNNISWVDPGNL